MGTRTLPGLDEVGQSEEDAFNEQITPTNPTWTTSGRLSQTTNMKSIGGVPRQLSLSNGPIKIVRNNDLAQCDRLVSESALPTKSEDKNHSREPRRQFSNLFPCPLVKTLDLDSPDGSLSSLGIVSGLNYTHAFPSSPSYSLPSQRNHRKLPPERTKSVQSSETTHCGHLCLTNRNQRRWQQPIRQSSLPVDSPPANYQGSPRLISSSSSRSPNYLSSHGIAPCRSPRSLTPARSMHAQTHKLRRQVTICEDSVSIPDSALLSCQPNGIGSMPQGHNQVPCCTSSLEGALPLGDANSIEKAITAETNPRLKKLLVDRQESSFTNEEIHSLQEAFAQLDLDGDGKLSRKEVEQVLGKILSESDLNFLLLDLDTDQDGEIEWNEFLHAMKARIREPESVKMLKEAFRAVADESDEGFTLTAAQMKESLMCAENKTTEKEIQEMLLELDLDHDGKVQMEDFVRLLVQEQHRQPENLEVTSDKCCIL